MHLVYQMVVSYMPLLRRQQIATHISSCFRKDFCANRLLEFENALVCQERGVVVGVALVRAPPGPPEDKLPTPHTLECVCVSEFHRGKGIGCELLDFAQTELGLPCLRLHVDRGGNPDYTRLRAWYQRHGFRINYENANECEMEWGEATPAACKCDDGWPD